MPEAQVWCCVRDIKPQVEESCAELKNKIFKECLDKRNIYKQLIAMKYGLLNKCTWSNRKLTSLSVYKI